MRQYIRAAPSCVFLDVQALWRGRAIAGAIGNKAIGSVACRLFFRMPSFSSWDTACQLGVPEKSCRRCRLDCHNRALCVVSADTLFLRGNFLQHTHTHNTHTPNGHSIVRGRQRNGIAHGHAAR
ncbi:hypothetical protein TW95_gp1092 [Pandoravirus inopinatum]|uniref:Uncharacterized protein n=1 Tax=Pandoravirus inopinatum TaxID=1605721 RepID=A0A0B5JA95_9VIRU|nr:hypothetical protein TW95_gp1092 [Pandoravirus inopinatum]AJF97826.1 hypothetical protein [Pandoravirus inopinatum]